MITITHGLSIGVLSLLFCSHAFALGFFSAPAKEAPEVRQVNYGIEHCPYQANFVMAELRIFDNQKMLLCRHNNGAIYYSELAQFALNPDDEAWSNTHHPTTWLCTGYHVEDCRLTRQVGY